MHAAALATFTERRPGRYAGCVGRAFRRAGVAIALGVLPALACERAPASEQDDAPAAGVKSFSSELADAICTLAFECCDDFALEAKWSTERECRTLLGDTLEEALGPSIQTLLDEGRARYDAADYAECLDEVVEKGCSVPQTLFDCVWDGFTGLVETGKNCRAPAECEDGACLGSASGNGTCGSPLASSSPCTGHLDCASGSCIDGYCHPRIPDGGACLSDAECASQSCDFAFVCRDQRTAFCRVVAEATVEPADPAPAPAAN
jgi:hypothetical protein